MKEAGGRVPSIEERHGALARIDVLVSLVQERLRSQRGDQPAHDRDIGGKYTRDLLDRPPFRAEIERVGYHRRCGRHYAGGVVVSDHPAVAPVQHDVRRSPDVNG